MRLRCPYCGDRDRREFTVMGAALDRPDPEADAEAWHDYLHLRDNPEGRSVELWHHAPCGTWIEVTRDTATHAVIATRAAAERRA